jgi:hypothetical protein
MKLEKRKALSSSLLIWIAILSFIGCQEEQQTNSNKIVLGDFEIQTERWGPSDEELDELRLRLYKHPQFVVDSLNENTYLLSFRVLDEVDKTNDDIQPTHFEAYFYDYINERTVRVLGDLNLQEALMVNNFSYQFPPTLDEFREAVRIIEQHDTLGTLLRKGEIVPYLSMPGVNEIEELDGSRRRLIIIGFYQNTEDTGQQLKVFDANVLYGISLSKRSIFRINPDLLGILLHHGNVCNPPPSTDQGSTPRWTSGSVRVKVRQNGNVIWTFRVTRPSNSSATRGSGIELSGIYYKGMKVLARSHVPILNVHYENNVCGPYRDWQYEETSFQATGTDFGSGFRICPTPASTIIESGIDQGNFKGVAIWVEGQEVILVSELSAGWYRYISKWRLHSNGTIKPQFGFAATANGCTCELHFHNCYWRFDFDIAGADGDRIQEYNNPPITTSNWHMKRYELMRYRDQSRNRSWKISDGNRGYTLIPGPNDGIADTYARGDVWFLRYHGSMEFDDGHNWTSSNTEANISKFDNDEYIVDKDVVLWYSAHFSHDVAHSHTTGIILGPELKPFGF